MGLLAGLLAGVVAINCFPDQVLVLYYSAVRWTNAAFHPAQLHIPAAPPPELIFPYKEPEGYAVLSMWAATEHSWPDDLSLCGENLPCSSLSKGFRIGAKTLADPQYTTGLGTCYPAPIRAEFDDAFRDFAAKSAHPWILEPARSLVIERGRLSPGDYVVSPVGFNADHTRALMFSSQIEGRMQFVLLRKEKGSWRIDPPYCEVIT